MPQFSASLGRGRDWQSATEACLANLDVSFTANVGFVYVTDVIGEHLQPIVEHLREATQTTQWIGTVGMGVCATGVEVYDEPAVSVLIGHLDDPFRVFSTNTAELSDLGSPVDSWIDDTGSFFGVVHGDPGNKEVVKLVESMSQRLGGGFFVGGLSCSRTGHSSSVADQNDAGLSGLLLHPNIRVATRLTQGCSPLGETCVITKSDKNIVYSLDGRPALEVLREQLNGISNESLARLGGYLYVGLPIVGSDTGDYLVRHLTGIDPESGAIGLDEWVAAEQRLLFCRRDQDSAVNDLQRMLGELKKALPEKPLAGIYYTCIGRGKNLFGDQCEELQTIQDALGDMPITGFYANGEISHNRLYAYTGVLTVFY